MADFFQGRGGERGKQDSCITEVFAKNRALPFYSRQPWDKGHWRSWGLVIGHTLVGSLLCVLGDLGSLCPSASCLDGPCCGLNVPPQGPVSNAGGTILGNCGLLEGKGSCRRDMGCWGRCREVVSGPISAPLSLLPHGLSSASHSHHHEVTWTRCDFPTTCTETMLWGKNHSVSLH